VAARQSAPVIGALCSRAEERAAKEGRILHPWTVTVGYRFQPSSRHFIGTVEQTQRELTHNQIQNIYHLFDVAVDYQLTPRWTISGSVPILLAYRNQLYAPKAKYEVAGISDISVGLHAAIFRPPTESGGNIVVGMSLKLPTGRDNSKQLAVSSSGAPVVATADQSIQAGDGGVGFALDLQAYHPAPFRTRLYFSGTYLFNPRDVNNVPTFRRAAGEQVMSVADQYLYRGGVSHAVPSIRGLTATIGGRIEGVPVRDAFGKSDGFRRPGYAISVDPGFLYSRGRYLFACNIPWAVERDRKRSVADIQNHTHGDAAFADYALIFSLSRRF
jgi:hypothetical protein